MSLIQASFSLGEDDGVEIDLDAEPSRGFGTKQQGEQYEHLFMAKLCQKAIRFCPKGTDCDPFDVIVRTDAGWKGIQVKGTNSDPNPNGTWRILAAGGSHQKVKYTENDIDFLALYVEKVDTWWIIPIIGECPIRIPIGNGVNAHWRENWDVLRTGIKGFSALKDFPLP